MKSMNTLGTTPCRFGSGVQELSCPPTCDRTALLSCTLPKKHPLRIADPILPVARTLFGASQHPGSGVTCPDFTQAYQMGQRDVQEWKSQPACAHIGALHA